MFILIAVCMGILAVSIAIKPLKSRRIVSTFLLGLAVLTGYSYWGSWSIWQKYEKEKVNQTQVKTLLETMEGTDAIIKKLQEKIKESPENAKGWYLLGRLYASKNDQVKALHAFEKARTLQPDDVAINVNYGKTLWQKNNKKFDSRIETIFKKLLKSDPRQPDALAMLAIAAYDKKNYQQAIQYWEQLLEIIPPQSPEAASIRQAIGEVNSS